MKIMHQRDNNSSVLHLLRLSSAALPVGAYSYSQGLEYACETGWVSNGDTAAEWINGVLLHGLAALDVPVLLRMYQAWEKQDLQAALHWNEYLLACRESSELRNEDRQTGHSLARLLRNLDIAEAEHCLSDNKPSLALSFSLAACKWNIQVAEAAYAYLWSWLENQIAVAIKLIPIGQTEGQKIISLMIPVVDAAVRIGLQIEDDQIYGSLPGLAVGSALHENQYSRMFQS